MFDRNTYTVAVNLNGEEFKKGFSDVREAFDAARRASVSAECTWVHRKGHNGSVRFFNGKMEQPASQTHQWWWEDDYGRGSYRHSGFARLAEVAKAF